MVFTVLQVKQIMPCAHICTTGDPEGTQRIAG